MDTMSFTSLCPSCGRAIADEFCPQCEQARTQESAEAGNHLARPRSPRTILTPAEVRQRLASGVPLLKGVA